MTKFPGPFGKLAQSIIDNSTTRAELEDLLLGTQDPNFGTSNSNKLFSSSELNSLSDLNYQLEDELHGFKTIHIWLNVPCILLGRRLDMIISKIGTPNDGMPAITRSLNPQTSRG